MKGKKFITKEEYYDMVKDNLQGDYNPLDDIFAVMSDDKNMVDLKAMKDSMQAVFGNNLSYAEMKWIENIMDIDDDGGIGEEDLKTF